MITRKYFDYSFIAAILEKRYFKIKINVQNYIQTKTIILKLYINKIKTNTIKKKEDFKIKILIIFLCVRD